MQAIIASGEPEEIAALAVAVQERQGKIGLPVDTIKKSLVSALNDMQRELRENPLLRPEDSWRGGEKHDEKL